MRRTYVFLGIALAACANSWGRTLWHEPHQGGLVLHWQPIDVGPGATDLRYDLAVHVAVQGLPRERVLLRTGIAETSLTVTELSAGDYVWSVRARYVREGAVWVTRWMGTVDALVPARGFAPIRVP